MSSPLGLNDPVRLLAAARSMHAAAARVHEAVAAQADLDTSSA